MRGWVEVEIEALTKWQSPKTTVTKYCSIRNHNNADIITGTETHLDIPISSSELFSQLSSHSNKRDFHKSKGRVLIALKTDTSGTHRMDLDINCLIIWINVNTQGIKITP